MSRRPTVIIDARGKRHTKTCTCGGCRFRHYDDPVAPSAGHGQLCPQDIPLRLADQPDMKPGERPEDGEPTARGLNRDLARYLDTGGAQRKQFTGMRDGDSWYRRVYLPNARGHQADLATLAWRTAKALEKGMAKP